MENNETVGKRFSELIAHLGISKNAFASSLDKTATVIQHLVDERNKPGFDLLCKVFEVYPNVSKDWLLQGAGSMLVTDESATTAPRPAALKTDSAQPAVVIQAMPTAEAPAPTLAVSPPPEPVVAQAALVAPAPPEPLHTVSFSPPAASVASVAPTPIVEAPNPAPLPVAPPTATPAPAAAPPVASVAPTAPDTSWQTALYTQQMAHQLAMAELRNQHLQDQQRMMQQMMDLMKQQMFK